MVITIIILGLLVGCGDKSSTLETPQGSEEVNLFTTRHYDTDQMLLDLFEAQTGIKVNVVNAGADELLERIELEGEDTVADLLITADAGRLFTAKDRDLLQPVSSETLFTNIPENLRDRDNMWFALTKRARVLVYAPDRVDPSELSTYEALIEPEWKGRVVARTSNNVYNQSLMASFIELWGEEKAQEWAEGLKENLAREPQGNDRDQAKAVAAGEADVAIMNTYYIGRMLQSADPEEIKVASNVAIFFPNQDTDGTHINISGIALTKHAKNPENAIKLMEFLSKEGAQKLFAEANSEFPANPNVEWSSWLQGLGDFKEQDINLTALGDNHSKAIMVWDRAGFK
ncbi:MAG: Fe(3+) ABC transporter substrate-binding protein [Desulfitibacter sp. BRH_c19]|nr:MAG: Fe(3+) ABC transporter substrate-binding protein [Desulfitibacter sp. BRH_c19]